MTDDRIVAFCVGWFFGCVLVDLYHRMRAHRKSAAMDFFDQHGEG